MFDVRSIGFPLDNLIHRETSRFDVLDHLFGLEKNEVKRYLVTLPLVHVKNLITYVE